MSPLNPHAAWMPYHVCMGRKVSDHSLKQPFDITDELAEAGCTGTIRMQLCLAARVATLAIGKMLASELT